MDLDAILGGVEAARRSQQAELSELAVLRATQFAAAERTTSQYRELCEQIAARLTQIGVETPAVFEPEPGMFEPHVHRSEIVGWPVAHRLLLPDGRLIGRAVRAGAMPAEPPPKPGSFTPYPQRTEAYLYESGMAALGERYCVLDSRVDALSLEPQPAPPAVPSSPRLAWSDLRWRDEFSRIEFSPAPHMEGTEGWAPLEETLARLLAKD